MIACHFHPDAATEFIEASLFYESRMVGLGKSFADEVERIISLIREFPDAGSPVGLAHRRILVDRFPYAVVYMRHSNFITVIAVAHQRRLPGYWRQR